jgi:hypothetical protein
MIASWRDFDIAIVVYDNRRNISGKAHAVYFATLLWLCVGCQTGGKIHVGLAGQAGSPGGIALPS